MRKSFFTCAVAGASILLANGQIAGNAAYNAENHPGSSEVLRQLKSMSPDEMPPTLNSVFLDATVLMNVNADSYVATFGVSEEGPSAQDAKRKAFERISRFQRDVKRWNSSRRVHVDFIAQNRVYGFEVSGSEATEKLAGFDVKENLTVPCASSAEVDDLIGLADKDGIFDLVKVDYVMKDLDSVRSRILAEASKVIRKKALSYRKLFGVKLHASPQVYADRFTSFYPTDSYASYQAAEGETIDPGFRAEQYRVHGARKMRTFYYAPLSGAGFDQIVNPIITTPVVQFAMYLKLRYASGSDNRLLDSTNSKR
jgi:uncharacterized protein YggE